MTRRRIATGLVILAVAAVIIAVARSRGAGDGQEEEIVTDVAVHVGKISRATLRRYVTAYGIVEPQPPGDGRPAAGADLATSAGGTLTEISCTDGQRVERGEILFRLDTRLAEAAVSKAEKELSFAEETHARQKELLDAHATSEKAFQEAELQLSAARDQLSAARTELSLLEIRAPFDGTVVRLNARLGQIVDPNTVLAQVIDLDRLVVTARVPSKDAGLLKPGQQVEFGRAGAESASAWAAAPAAPVGEVTVVGKDIDPATDTVLLRASTPAGSGFQPGRFLAIRVVCEERKDVLAVPEESVVTGPGGGPVLMMVEGETAVPKSVKTGLRERGLTEVEGEGLKEGMAIVTTEAYDITGETKIHVIGND